MGLTLVPITKDNWEEAIELTVKEEQKQYVASNLYSIAEVQFLDQFHAAGIYSGETMIGFTMYGIDPDDKNYWIYRLMVDQAYQGKGHGTEAVKTVVEEIKRINTSGIRLIMIGYHQENDGARAAYKKAGFVETEVAPWGEQLASYHL
ncbi:GNAT family N-acetyltransferase [Mesobacillus subterraneus]|uniref:GNAT family N-acetyltransferase n=1 Tax=Mesobacillus subterraneus TaxID=285983 RepID=A0A3R9KYC1_9BACI|nr:GNAT family N-acetyltransferase [Mesobacillus subterraneus]RSD28849.1 GNAT family N-acetyltransferase [Mesobacillus subterraneus]